MQVYLMKKILLILTFFIVINSFSQEANKPKFTSINSFGIITGTNQSVFSMQTINGFRLKKWVHGLGFVLDNYGSQSSPIFLHTEKSFGNNEKFFAYANAGVNIPWRTTNFPKQTTTNQPYYDLKIKPYGELGFGIRKSLQQSNLAFRFFVGYSIKQFGYTEYNSWNVILPILPPDNSNPNANYLFTYRRLSLNFGLEF